MVYPRAGRKASIRLNPKSRPRETELPLAASIDPVALNWETAVLVIIRLQSALSDRQLRAAMSGRWSCATLALGAQDVTQEALLATPERSEAEILQELKAGDRASAFFLAMYTIP